MSSRWKRVKIVIREKYLRDPSRREYVEKFMELLRSSFGELSYEDGKYTLELREPEELDTLYEIIREHGIMIGDCILLVCKVYYMDREVAEIEINPQPHILAMMMFT